MKRAIFVLLFLWTVAAGATTVDNDDSCDISVLPAATLLLPYFEVDLEDMNGETTIFTITNVTNLEQIAHVTLWTDYGFPVINFNIYLTGYDVQAINLFDILARGIIAPDAGTGTTVRKRGAFSDANAALDVSRCERLPGAVDPVYITRMQDAFTQGIVRDLGTLAGCTNIGGVHVQAINLHDVIARGIIAPDGGTGTGVRARGEHSGLNPALDLAECSRLPGSLPNEAVVRMQSAFTLGRIPGGCNIVSLPHDNAVGYATIDVVRTCSDNVPTDAEYWTEDVLYDNVLIGDSQQVNGFLNFAQGSTMVHIRAVPEGGTPSTRAPSPFQHTFYRRYQSAVTPQRDGRQPLPTTFASRWIQGGASAFQTSLKIWREGKTGRDATCDAHGENRSFGLIEIVRFDEAENAVADLGCQGCNPPLPILQNTPATSLTSITDSSLFPQFTNGALAGWVYLNLDYGESDSYGSSNWVVTSMRAEGRYSVDMDAAALGNGCSAPVSKSEVSEGTAIIGPAPNVR